MPHEASCRLATSLLEKIISWIEWVCFCDGYSLQVVIVFHPHIFYTSLDNKVTGCLCVYLSIAVLET